MVGARAALWRELGPVRQRQDSDQGQLRQVQLDTGRRLRLAVQQREVAPGRSARVGYTYIQNQNTWLQIPSQIPMSGWDIPDTVYDGGPTVASCFSTTPGRCPVVGAPITIWDLNPAYKGAAFSQTMYVNRTDGDRYGTIEATVIKRPGSGKWNVLASYTITKNHAFEIDRPLPHHGPRSSSARSESSVT
jgi:hypothetical protein